jgi:hypothetical protein
VTLIEEGNATEEGKVKKRQTRDSPGWINERNDADTAMQRRRGKKKG